MISPSEDSANIPTKGGCTEKKGDKKARTIKLLSAMAGIIILLSAGIFSWHLANGSDAGDGTAKPGTRSGGNQARQLLRLSEEIERLMASASSPADSARLLEACRTAGDRYRTMGNDARALMLYKEATNIAICIGDRPKLPTLYNNIFSIYYRRGEYERAADLLEMSLAIYREAGDSLGICRIYNNIGLVSYERGRFAEALEYTGKALGYTRSGDHKERAAVYTNRGEIFYRQGLYKDAERESDMAVACLEKANGADLIQTYLNAALVKAKLHKRHEMERLLNSTYGLLEKAAPPVRSNSYRQLADIKFAAGDSLAGLRDMLVHERLADSLRRADTDTKVQELLAEYDADRLKQRNENLRQSVKVRSIVLYVVLLSAVILGVLAALLIRRIRLDRKKNRLINEQQSRLYKYEQAENERKQRELSMEIDHKKRQLTSYTLNLAGVNEFCAALLAQLQEVKDGMAAGQGGMDEGKAAALRQKVDEVMHSLQHYNDKPVGEDFRMFFDEVHPDFLRRLSLLYPNLSKNDLRLCAYLHLGMSTKEIAALTYREVRSVESSRNRLRKKLGLPAEKSLQDFLKETEKQAENTDKGANAVVMP